mmetsp:Transcript_54010/g.80589  ORF Transcript_54010/g.80589 Transcript_54010/m.80589 type:complete len:100 (+) Transcript_54010:747-1046(+)
MLAVKLPNPAALLESRAKMPRRIEVMRTITTTEHGSIQSMCGTQVVVRAVEELFVELVRVVVELVEEADAVDSSRTSPAFSFVRRLRLRPHVRVDDIFV